MLISQGGGASGGIDSASFSSSDKSPGRFSFSLVSYSFPS